VEPMLSADAAVNQLFDRAMTEMQARFGYTAQAASALVREYYTRFRDPQYCDGIHIPVQDDDFFFHEGAGGMALRVHYYLGLEENPEPMKFIDWRADYFRQRRARR
jgi:hypothetical protein